MKFIHRLGYYLGGFAIGLIFLAFFLSGKRASCDYGPEARVLKNINIKKHFYTEDALTAMVNANLDSLTIEDILHNGNVKFKESTTDLDSCNIYVIQDEINDQIIKLKVMNCDSVAKITEVAIKK